MIKSNFYEKYILFLFYINKKFKKNNKAKC